MAWQWTAGVRLMAGPLHGGSHRERDAHERAMVLPDKRGRGRQPLSAWRSEPASRARWLSIDVTE